MDWDTYFMLEAYIAAMKSKDRRTQVGACIVGPDHEIRSKGYNGAVRGEDDTLECLHVQPTKSYFIEHAERNAIYHLSRLGVSGKGCTLYCTLSPCVDCARAIIQTGISKLVLHHPDNVNYPLTESQKKAQDLFDRIGLEISYWNGIFPKLEVMIDGKSFELNFSN